MLSVASVRGLQAGAAGSRPSGAAGASRAGWCQEESGGPTKEHALIARRDVSPSHGAHQARSGVSIGGSSLRHRLHLPLQGQISRIPVTKYKLPLFIGGEQKEAPQSGTEGDKGGMALSRKLRLGSTLKLKLTPSSASGQRNAKAAWL